MQEPSERLIDNYIKRITEFSQNVQRIPTTEELDKIVSELGITDEQIAATQTESQSHFVRAKSYMKLKQWDDTIIELQEGISLNPFNLEMISCLGEAYMGRWNLKHKKEDAINIQMSAKKCLQIKPDSEEAMNLLSRFNRSLQWRKNSLIFIGVTLFILVIAGISIFFMKDLSRSAFLSNPFIASLFNKKTTLDFIKENIKSLENKQLTLQKEMNYIEDKNIKFLENKQLLLQEEVTALRAEQSTLKSELDILQKKIGKQPINEKSSLSDSPD